MVQHADIDHTGLTGVGVGDAAAHIADTSAAHAASAVSVNSTTLSGTGTDVQAALEEIDNLLDDHSARHENGGADEISVAGLSGELADPQPVKDHNHTASAGDGGDLDSAVIDGLLIFNEESAPSTPASGTVAVYAKSDGRIYSKDDAGTEYGPFDAAGGGGGSFDGTHTPDAGGDLWFNLFGGGAGYGTFGIYPASCRLGSAGYVICIAVLAGDSLVARGLGKGTAAVTGAATGTIHGGGDVAYTNAPIVATDDGVAQLVFVDSNSSHHNGNGGNSFCLVDIVVS